MFFSEIGPQRYMAHDFFHPQDGRPTKVLLIMRSYIKTQKVRCLCNLTHYDELDFFDLKSVFANYRLLIARNASVSLLRRQTKDKLLPIAAAWQSVVMSPPIGDIFPADLKLEPLYS